MRSFSSFRPVTLLPLLSLFALSAFAAPKAPTKFKTQHVVMVVWDGMRPDFVSPKYTPTLYKLAQGGVTFAHHHPVYPSSTEVNGTALATGMYPANSGIIGNREYRPAIDKLNSIATEDLESVREGDKMGKYLAVPTVAELVQNDNYRTSVAGTKGVVLLADRAEKRSSRAAQSSTDVFVGNATPQSSLPAILKEQGPFPPTITFPNTGQDAWTTAALTKSLWKAGVPRYSMLWLSDVDFTQHETSPGSPTSLAALKSCDDQLAKVLQTLDAKGVRSTTSVFVVSDHGFSTIGRDINVVKILKAAGFNAEAKWKSAPQKGDVTVVGLSGSAYLYVGGHDAVVTKRLVSFFQGSDVSGVIFTRAAQPGTFGMDKIHIDSPHAPDVAVAFRWGAQLNRYGTPGGIVAEGKRKAGKGSHATLSRFDMHNTLIANGPDFKRGFIDTTPTGNTDVAPTILQLLGIGAPQRQDGRVLTEALIGGAKAPVVQSGRSSVSFRKDGSGWTQYLIWKQIGRTIYFDEGNGQQTRAR